MAIVKVAKDVILANHHTGPITLPRVYQPNASGDPATMQAACEAKTIQPGSTVSIPAEEWEIRSKSDTLKYYLDHKHLAVVKRDGEVEVNTSTIGELEIPEHLQQDAEGNVTAASTADGSQVKAGLRKVSKGEVTV